MVYREIDFKFEVEALEDGALSERAIKAILEENQEELNKFEECITLPERADVDSIEVGHVSLTDKKMGTVELVIAYSIYNGCKDMNVEDDEVLQADFSANYKKGVLTLSAPISEKREYEGDEF